MVEMTIQVSDALAAQLETVRDRLPELLAHGLEELSPVPNQVYRYILQFLISQPSPEELMRFGPTTEIQSHVNELLEKNRMGMLTPAEDKELDEYIQINHFITMLKAKALPYLTETGA